LGRGVRMTHDGVLLVISKSRLKGRCRQRLDEKVCRTVRTDTERRHARARLVRWATTEPGRPRTLSSALRRE
jgi:hypothetical protein